MTYRQQVLRASLLWEGYRTFRFVRRLWLWRYVYETPALLVTLRETP